MEPGDQRLSGVAQQQGVIPSSYCGEPVEQNAKLGSLGRFDIQALAASGQIPPQTLAALHAELLGRPTGSIVFPAMDQPLLQSSIQGPKGIPADHGVAYGQPLIRCPSNVSKQFPQTIISEDVYSGLGAWPCKGPDNVGPSTNISVLGAQSDNMLLGMLQNQQQQQKQTILPEPSRSINVQPSCLVVPTQSPASFQAGKKTSSVNQSCSFNRNSANNYSLLPSQSNNSSFGVGQLSDGDLKSSDVLNAFSGPVSISPSLLSCSTNADNGVNGQPQNSILASTAGPLRNLGFVGKGTSIPSRFAVDEAESPMSNLNFGKVHGENNANKVKQEPSMDFIGSAKVGIPILQNFTPNDLMSVFSE
ncbi:hypothetical protein U1Q18_018366 [Sarracenia purpurea var. burkii]